MLLLALSFQLLTFSPLALPFRFTRLPLAVTLKFADFLPWPPEVECYFFFLYFILEQLLS